MALEATKEIKMLNELASQYGARQCVRLTRGRTHTFIHKYCLQGNSRYSCGAKVLNFLNAERKNRDAKSQRKRSYLKNMRGSIALFCGTHIGKEEGLLKKAEN